MWKERTEQEIITAVEKVPYGSLVREIFYKNIKPDTIQVAEDLILAQTTFTPEQQIELGLIATLREKQFYGGNGVELAIYQADTIVELLKMMRTDNAKLCVTIWAAPQSTGVWRATKGDEYTYGLGISLKLAKESFASRESTQGEGYIWILERCIEATKLFNDRTLLDNVPITHPF